MDYNTMFNKWCRRGCQWPTVMSMAHTSYSWRPFPVCHYWLGECGPGEMESLDTGHQRVSTLTIGSVLMEFQFDWRFYSASGHLQGASCPHGIHPHHTAVVMGTVTAWWHSQQTKHLKTPSTRYILQPHAEWQACKRRGSWCPPKPWQIRLNGQRHAHLGGQGKWGKMGKYTNVNFCLH